MMSISICGGLFLTWIYERIKCFADIQFPKYQEKVSDS